MALSFDDKILGEKTDYYCSSSEDEQYDSCEEHFDESSGKFEKMPTAQSSELSEYSGHSLNTGPKGVIEDWRRYKQLETEKREGTEKERMNLAKKLSMTCRTHLEDEKEKLKDEAYLEEIEEILDEFDDDFMKEYRTKRIESLRNATSNVPKFGHVVELTKSNFLDAIDKENPTATIIVHIYKRALIACNSMNKSFEILSMEYPTVKFCRIEATEVQLSLNFSISGVPALLVYKKGELIGNFVRLSDEFGEEFYSNDVESFLLEHGLLPDNPYHKSSIVRTERIGEDSDSD